MNDPDGAAVCPSALLPQHSTVPSVRSPHEWKPLAETWVNDPDGAVVCPDRLLPQHSTDWSVRSPHECCTAAETWVNDPAGAVARPSTLRVQHSTVPSVRTPHECCAAAETWVNDPAGAVACPSALLPQHSTVPSVRTPHECTQPAEMTPAVTPALGVVGCTVAVVVPGQVRVLDLAVPWALETTTHTCSSGYPYQHPPSLQFVEVGQCHVAVCRVAGGRGSTSRPRCSHLRGRSGG